MVSLFFMKTQSQKDKSAKTACFGIESYGVRISFEVGEGLASTKIKKRLRHILPNGFVEIKTAAAAHRFRITSNDDATFNLGEGGRELIAGVPEPLMFEQLDRRIRLTVAEFAVEKVFLHAGVVAWKDRAIIIPAKSFQGKTTLVAELVKKGAVYYSDEYAVLDEDALVHPFPKMLSMRGIIDDFQQLDVPVEKFGGVAGNKAIPVGLIVLTQYKKGARWLPKSLSPGRGLMEIIAHTLPIRNKPEFTLKVLNNMMNRAIITKTKRGDAAQAADLIIGFFEKQAQKS